MKVNEILDILAELYPQAACALEHRNAFELLIATILSLPRPLPLRRCSPWGRRESRS
jgi:hypothetical protein